jgi:putative oxidoreductase
MNRDLGVLALRLAFGFQLIYVSWKTVIYLGEHLQGFADYARSLHIPFPTAGAALSAYTDTIGGLLLILGFQTRLASALLLFNFTVAVVMGHLAINDTYQNSYPSINIWAVCFFLLLNGPGRYSLDERKWR